jgi:hypothetical protein
MWIGPATRAPRFPTAATQHLHRTDRHGWRKAVEPVSAVERTHHPDERVHARSLARFEVLNRIYGYTSAFRQRSLVKVAQEAHLTKARTK